MSLLQEMLSFYRARFQLHNLAAELFNVEARLKKELDGKAFSKRKSLQNVPFAPRLARLVYANLGLFTLCGYLRIP